MPGLVSYQASTSCGSVWNSTPHSAQPVCCDRPSSTAARSLLKTVPEEVIVGGVPHRIVWGLRLSDTTYLRALSSSSPYSWASSMTSRSKPSPRPPLEERVRYSMRAPFSSVMDSEPLARMDEYGIWE